MVTSGLVNVFTRTPAEGLPDHVEMTASGLVLALSTATTAAARRP